MVPKMSMKKHTPLSTLTTTRVSYISLYYGCSGSVPIVMVTMMPNNQINTVRHTSAKDLETGEIILDTVTAIGTEMLIEMTRPTLRSMRKVLEVTCDQYVAILYI